MRILVTGGFGYIGGRISNHLIQAGHQVFIGTRTIDGNQNWFPKNRIVKIDWKSEGSLNAACSTMHVVIHAAGMNSKECEDNPKNALEVNGESTGRLVAAAVRNGVDKFIYLSTAHVYASPLEGYLDESSIPANNHPYATSHHFGENEVLNKSLNEEMRGIVLRISNAFGVPMDNQADCWGLLVNDLCRQAVRSKKIVLRTDGFQQRDFISIGELCKIIEYFSITKVSPELGRIFNIGTGYSNSVQAMAKLIQERCYKTLGFYPELVIGNINTRGNYGELIYKVDLLKSLKIVATKSTYCDDIDQLLLFCKNAFDEA
jgi:UDP-glucose 4-epimerase